MDDLIFKVVIHFAAEYGQIEYDPRTRKVKVLLPDSAKRQAVEEYLNRPHVISDADGADLLTFHEKTVFPTENLASLKLALTRMWHHTQVYVDWSRTAN
jgi:hypothetical protein